MYRQRENDIKIQISFQEILDDEVAAFADALPEKSAPVIDMIFSVRNPNLWHRKNLDMNGRHYAQPLRSLGASAVCTVQELGAHVFYHPIVDLDDEGGRRLKYGVVSTENLTRDLRDWTTLFCAGRLQKPSLIMKQTDEVREAQEKNLRSAVLVSALQMPRKFSPMDLFLAIAGLSYRGDPRFDFGAENRDKVRNIVEANVDGFVSLYKSHVARCDWIEGPQIDACDVNERCLRRPNAWSECAAQSLEKDLPREFSKRLVGDVAGLGKLFRNSDGLSEAVDSALAGTVRDHARLQYAKGPLTAGLLKSVAYLKAKWAKGALSKR
eukprot:g2153.t1